MNGFPRFGCPGLLASADVTIKLNPYILANVMWDVHLSLGLILMIYSYDALCLNLGKGVK